MQATDTRGIVRGIFTPAERIRRMPGVEQRPGDVRRLRCSTCKYEVTSIWFFTSSQGTRSLGVFCGRSSVTCPAVQVLRSVTSLSSTVLRVFRSGDTAVIQCLHLTGQSLMAITLLTQRFGAWHVLRIAQQLRSGFGVSHANMRSRPAVFLFLSRAFRVFSSQAMATLAAAWARSAAVSLQ